MIIPNTRISPADEAKPVTDDYIRALNLNKKIIVSAQLAQQNLYDMCTGFKEMRDSKLYKELGYSDFGDYCEQETGFKRSQAYNYIAIAEKLPEDFVQSIGQIGMTKVLLLTNLSDDERSEITANTDLRNTTVKELEQQIKQLKTENMLANTNLGNVERNYAELEKRHRKLGEENTALSLRVKDLEARPLPVQVVEKIPDQYVDISAYEKLVNQTNAERDRMDAEFLALKRQLNTTEQQLEEARSKPPEKVTDQTAVYNALMDTAADALDRLMEFVEHNGGEFGGLYDTFINSHRRTTNETL